MSAADHEKWEAKYRAGPPPTEPSSLVTELDALLPRRGRALDVAGGAGRHALWLARRGLAVTLCDISETALTYARDAARAEGLALETVALDLESASPPAGPWDVVLSFHYLQRGLFPTWPALLAPGGLLVFVQPTRKNLERHPKPGASFLLEEGELPALAQGLEVIRYEEGWMAEGRHEARLVARKAV